MSLVFQMIFGVCLVMVLGSSFDNGRPSGATPSIDTTSIASTTTLRQSDDSDVPRPPPSRPDPVANNSTEHLLYSNGNDLIMQSPGSIYLNSRDILEEVDRMQNTASSKFLPPFSTAHELLDGTIIVGFNSRTYSSALVYNSALSAWQNNGLYFKQAVLGGVRQQNGKIHIFEEQKSVHFDRFGVYLEQDFACKDCSVVSMPSLDRYFLLSTSPLFIKEIVDTRINPTLSVTGNSTIKTQLEGKSNYATVGVDDMMFVIGGKSSSQVFTSTCHFIQVSNTPMQLNSCPDLNQARASFPALSISEFIVVAGGRSSTGHIASLELLDTKNLDNGWRTIAQQLPTARYSMGALTRGEWIYIVGGQDGHGPISDTIACKVHHQSLTMTCGMVQDLPEAKKDVLVL